MSAETAVRIINGQRVKITDTRPESLVGYVGTVRDIPEYDGDVYRVILDSGQPVIDGYEHVFGDDAWCAALAVEPFISADLVIGATVEITGHSRAAESGGWIGLRGTITPYSGTPDGSVHIDLLPGFTRPDGCQTGFIWRSDLVKVIALSESVTATPESAVEATEEPEAEVTYEENEIVRVTSIYHDGPCEPFYATYSHRMTGDYMPHIVYTVSSGSRYRVAGLEKVPDVAAVMREMIKAKTVAESERAEMARKMTAEHNAWKIDASVKGMRVAIQNAMCSQTERALHEAGMPTMLTADVSLTLRMDVPIREYVKAVDMLDDDGDPVSDTAMIDRISYMLAEMTKYPAYKWENIITSATGIKISEEQNEHENCDCAYCQRGH